MKNLFIRPRLWLTALFLTVGVITLLSTGNKKQMAQEKPVANLKAFFAQYAGSDQITSSIRGRSTELLRIKTSPDEDRVKFSKIGRIIQDLGSFVIVAKNRKTDTSALKLDSQIVETAINLPGGKFDPILSPPANTIIAGEKAVFGGKGYFIVQFGGTATDEWLDSIRDAGVEVLQYIPHQAFLVYGDSDAISKVADHSRVRWVGGYTAEQKQSQHLAEFVQNTKSGPATFDIAVFARADLDEVATQFTGMTGGRVMASSKLPHNFFNVLRVEMPAGEISAAASLPDVFRIDPYIKPVKEDERAAQVVAGNYTSTTAISGPGYNPLVQFGADGTGITVAVADDGISIPGNGGFYITAANTVNGPLRGATAGASGGHGHLNAGIIAGNTPFSILDPTGYNYGLGVAPKSNIINIPFLKSGNTTTDAQSMDDTLTTLGPNGVRGTISNNSWGAGANLNAYDSLAAQYDGLVQDGSAAASIDPVLIIFSAGNCGNAPAGSACSSQNGLTRPKVAKNVISVGNSENLRTELGGSGANNIDDLQSSSSRGLAADGRIKPDITAPGYMITGGGAGDGSTTFGFLPGDANHLYSGGTSHSAPQVAGAAALFSQYWKDSHAGVYPSPALTKSSIISSAQEMNANLTSASVPNGNEGWGRINMKLMMNTGVGMKYVDQSVALSNPGESHVVSGTVADSSKPVRVTLVWTDPPGAADPALVNDLDLTVTIGGNTYRGNAFTGGVSTTGGTADTKNNVENIFLPAGIPAGTAFSITIGATALNGNGILGNADATDQNFALVAYNFSETVSTVFNVSGRVVTSAGRAIGSAKVKLTDPVGGSKVALTNSFGFFSFANVTGGQVYTASVTRKGFTISPQGITVNSDITGINFVAAP